MNSLRRRFRRSEGFTLTELLVATSLISLIVLGAVLVSITQKNMALATTLRMEADHDLNMAISRFVYGSGTRRGIRSASTASSALSGRSWTLTYVSGTDTSVQTNNFHYSASQSNITFNPGNLLIAENISSARIWVATDYVGITMRVDRVRGRHTAVREVGTTLRMRN
jgi:prepilin-type N-terminal cleavage/methylation domain-containing protein